MILQRPVVYPGSGLLRSAEKSRREYRGKRGDGVIPCAGERRRIGLREQADTGPHSGIHRRAGDSRIPFLLSPGRA